MEDAELIQQFIRQKNVGDSVHLLVCVIGWKRPGTPTSRWKVAGKISLSELRAKFDTETARILRDARYFGVCSECGKRKPCGRMHEKELCQSCATTKHGVVY